MLQSLTFESLAEKWEFLAGENPSHATWLVSDLKSKQIIQEKLLQRFECVPEIAVLRISEFWRKLLGQNYPDYEIVSSSLVQTALNEWLGKKDIVWAHLPGTGSILIKYIQIFLPVIANPLDQNRIRDWLKENPQALLRWGGWFELANEAWEFFSDKKMLAGPWVPAFLGSKAETPFNGQPKIIADLGPNLSGLELEVLNRMSQNSDVHIVLPSKIKDKKFAVEFWPYQLVNHKKVQNQDLPNPPEAKPVRFSTQLAEIKAATQWVREALDNKTPIDKIGIFSANIEDYWPVLEPYLSVEGIPVQKPVVVNIQSLPAVGRWLSHLRLEIKKISTGDLETVVFDDPQLRQLIQHEEFSALFNKMYDERDLQRTEKLKNYFNFKFKPDDLLNRDAFLLWSLKFVTEGYEGIEKILVELLAECPSLTNLKLRSWISYLESLAAKIETIVHEGDPGGILCGNLDITPNIDLDVAIILNASEEGLNSPAELSLSQLDVRKINSDMGVHLLWPENTADEYYIADLFERSKRNYLCFAETDFSGSPLSPSRLWLEAATQNKVKIDRIESPEKTRWDEIQHDFINRDDGDQLKSAVLKDCGLKPHSSYPPVARLRYSASSIEKYFSCPFKFSAEKLFNLVAEPEIDLDMDARDRGRFLHTLMERLLQSPEKFLRDTREVSTLIENVRDGLAIVLGDDRLWPIQRNYYFEIAKRFLRFESDWRKIYQESETCGREIFVKGELDLSENKKITVSGRIDRVDRDKAGRYVVIDYKTSGSRLHNYGSWLDNNEIQLLFYSLCLEAGLTDLPSQAVIGAFYFTLNNMQREKGFRDENSVGTLFGPSPRSKTHIERQELQALYEKLKEKLSVVIDKIEAGEFSPKPEDEKDCKSCDWRTVCRSPHLN